MELKNIFGWEDKDDQAYFKEYFEKIASIRSEMEANGEGHVRHKDIHAGQVLLYAMAEAAKAAATSAKRKADRNEAWIRVIAVVLFVVLVSHAQQIPDVIIALGKLFGIAP